MNICLFLKAFEKMTFYHCTHLGVFRCSAIIPGCSTVPPVFCILLFRCSWFYSMPLIVRNKEILKMNYKSNHMFDEEEIKLVISTILQKDPLVRTTTVLSFYIIHSDTVVTVHVGLIFPL